MFYVFLGILTLHGFHDVLNFLMIRDNSRLSYFSNVSSVLQCKVLSPKSSPRLPGELWGEKVLDNIGNTLPPQAPQN